VESGDEIVGLANSGKKRKVAEIHGDKNAGKAKKETVNPKDVQGKADTKEDLDDDDGGVKLYNPIDLSHQAKKLKIGDKRIAPPAPALKEKSGKEVKRKASKAELGGGKKGKKVKA